MAEKRLDLDFPRHWKRYWISTNDVQELKDGLKPGDIVEIIAESEVELNGKLCVRNKVVKAKVVEMHKNVLMVSVRGKVQTIQYKDILMCQVSKFLKPEVK